MRNFLLLPVLLACTLCVHAQKQKPPIVFRSAISMSPLALLQVDYTFLTGIERRINTSLGVVLEAGYIFGSGYLNNSGDNYRAGGFIVRPSVKFYPNERGRFYVQPQLFYKQVTHRMYDWLGHDCVNGVPAFEQQQSFKYRRVITGAHIIAGELVPLSKKGTSFIDFYAGLGLRHKRAHIVNLPNSCYDRRGVFGGTQNQDIGTYPSIPGGIRFVFVIN